MGGSASTYSSPQAFAVADKANNDWAQTQADAYQKYYNPEVANFDPKKMMEDTIELQKYADMVRKNNPELDPYAGIRDELKAQTLADLKGPDQYVKDELTKSGLASALSQGQNIYRGLSRGASATGNVLGRGLLDYRDKQQDQAAFSLNQGETERVIPNAGELVGYKYATDQARMDARNNKAAGLVGINRQNLVDKNNQDQRMQAAIQQWGAGAASADNAMRGAKMAMTGQLIGAGIGAVGAIGGAAIF